MAEHLKRNDDRIILSIDDVKSLLKKWKKTIWRGALIGTSIAIAFSLIRSTKFQAEATFYEKAKTNNSTKNAAMLLLGEEKENSAVVMLKSHKIIEAAIKKLDLQATLEPHSYIPGVVYKIFQRLGYIKDNLIVQTAYLTGREYPSIDDVEMDLVAKQIEYSGEIPLYLDIQFVSDDRFTVTDSRGGLLGEAALGQSFDNKGFSFTLYAQKPADLWKKKRYALTLKPSRELAEDLSNDLKVVSDYKDKSYIILTLQYRTRQGAGDLLNAIMDSYREHLIQDHHQTVVKQVAYLQQRRGVIEKELGSLMEEHAQQMSAHAGSLDVLAGTQQSLQLKLLQIDLQIKHIQNALREGSYLQANYSSENEPPVVHKAIAEIRLCRQQCDSIDIVLRNAKQKTESGNAFETQWNELALVEECKNEVTQLIDALEQNSPLSLSPQLEKLPRYRIDSWKQKLNTLQMGSNNEYADFKSKFIAYLTQLVHHFEVHLKTLQDRLIYQQSPSRELQGINLETANELYLACCQELHTLEANASQTKYIFECVQNPDFELSSLAGVLSDPISSEIIKKAGSLSLAMQDHTNRTQRELERLGQDLDLQRNFLTLHLQQMLDLEQLRMEVLQSKIHAIQEVTFELLRKKISIQEKYLLDYTTSRLNSLKQEQQLILKQKQELQSDFERLPEQWAAEKLVDLYLKSSKTVMENVGNLIETKNIADHLEMSQSAPFDLARPPLHPNSPHIFLFGLLGALLGALGVTGYALGQSALHGIKASSENLRFAGQYVAGKISATSAIPEDVETYRHLLAYLCPAEEKKESGQAFLLLQSKGVRYGAQLANLLARRKIRVLLLDLCFDTMFTPARNGLWQYLQGASKELPIIKKDQFDLIESGGIYPYGCELLESASFRGLLSQLLQQYDWIIAESGVPLFSAEAEVLGDTFERIAVTVQGETIQELQPYFEEESHRRAFIIAEDEV